MLVPCLYFSKAVSTHFLRRLVFSLSLGWMVDVCCEGEDPAMIELLSLLADEETVFST